MDDFRIKGFSDDSVINGIGSFFRRSDGVRWFININTSPTKKDRSYLTLSQAPIMVRQRILNSKTEYSTKGYHKSFIIKDTHDWLVAKVKDCAVIKKYQKGDSEQYCFTFQIAEGITVYLPQFELALALFFHDGYTSHRFQKQLKNNNITASMSGRGACLDNAVVERFFGSLKNEWLLNIYHLTRQGMKEDVEAYIRYYNQIRLHTSNGDCSPIEFEQSTINVSYAA